MTNEPSKKSNRSQVDSDSPIEVSGEQARDDQQKPPTDADHLYTLLKPLHNLPRGKNTWNPKFIKIWWFWPASALFLLVMFYVYPFIWDFFAGR